MQLTSMKGTAEDYAVDAPSKPDYPWGLSITLNDEVLTKLGMSLPEVGDTMMIEAKVKVTSVSAHDSEYGKDRSVSLQITDLAVAGEGNDDLASALYKD